MVARLGVAAEGFPKHPHMLRHACGFKLANDGVDTRSLQAYLGHRNIQHTVRYTELAPTEEGFEAVLSRKRSMTPPVAAIFDGEKEAKLIALACSKPPKGRARWTLRLLESKVVELGIVKRASDSTIGRTLKKLSQAASQAMLGHPAEGQQRLRCRHGRCAGRLHAAAQFRLPAGVPG